MLLIKEKSNKSRRKPPKTSLQITTQGPQIKKEKRPEHEKPLEVWRSLALVSDRRGPTLAVLGRVWFSVKKIREKEILRA